MTNAEFARTDEAFLEACGQVALIKEHKNFEPSKRQASKWRRRRGIAWKVGRPKLS